MAQAEQGGTSWLPEQCLVWLPRGLPPAKPGAKAQVPAPRGGAAWQHFPAKPKPWGGGTLPNSPRGKRRARGWIQGQGTGGTQWELGREQSRRPGSAGQHLGMWGLWGGRGGAPSSRRTRTAPGGSGAPLAGNPPSVPSPCDKLQVGCQARLITEPLLLLPLMRPLG